MSVIYRFKNIKSEGNYLFQYASGRKLSDIYHSHDFYEIIIIVSGECCKIINDEEYILRKDNIIFLLPGDRHYFKMQSEDVAVVSLSVEKNEFERLSDIFTNSLSIKTAVFNYPDAYSKFCSLIGEFSNNLREKDCRLLLSYFLRIYGSDTNIYNNGLPADLCRAVREMEKCQNMKRGIEAFIELSHYSRSHLAKLMKRYYGMTIHDYLFDLRLSEAYRQLTLTNARIEDIAENVGYESFSHFNQIFKKKYGITPAALRKNRKVWTV